MQRDKLERLTDGGYCASPRYCQKRDQLAYIKMVGGTMQLFVCDLKTKVHTQLTSDAGNKEECSWSPCGNYMLFSVEQGKKTAIAMLNLLSNERRQLTSAGVSCSYPDWSPIYAQFPLLTAI